MASISGRFNHLTTQDEWYTFDEASMERMELSPDASQNGPLSGVRFPRRVDDGQGSIYGADLWSTKYTSAIETNSTPTPMEHQWPLNRLSGMKGNLTAQLIYTTVSDDPQTWIIGNLDPAITDDWMFKAEIFPGYTGVAKLLMTLKLSKTGKTPVRLAEKDDNLWKCDIELPTGTFGTGVSEKTCIRDLQYSVQESYPKVQTFDFVSEGSISSGFNEPEDAFRAPPPSPDWSHEARTVFANIRNFTNMQDQPTRCHLEIRFKGQKVSPGNSFEPFKWAVDSRLPFWYGYRHATTHEPILSLDMQTVDVAMHGTVVNNQGQVYAIALGVGHVREYQTETLTRIEKPPRVLYAGALFALRCLLDPATNPEVQERIIGNSADEVNDLRFVRRLGSNGAISLELDFERDMVYLMKHHWKFDQDQRHAAIMAFKAPIMLIEGAAGSGKSRIVAALLWLYALAGKRVLACSSSRAPLDRLTELATEIRPLQLCPNLQEIVIIRLQSGHLDLEDSPKAICLALGYLLEAEHIYQAMSAESDGNFEPEEIATHRRGAYSVDNAIMAFISRHASKEGSWKSSVACEVVQAGLSARKSGHLIYPNQYRVLADRYRELMRQVLASASIIMVSCNDSANVDLAGSFRPDAVIIDNTRHSPEIESLIPLVLYQPARRILAGDREQLRPRTLSKDRNDFAEQREYSAFDRYADLGYPKASLSQNRRSSRQILRVLQDLVYSNTYPSLRPANNLTVHRNVVAVTAWARFHHNISSETVFLDVANGFEERETEETWASSRFNIGEAETCAETIYQLIYPADFNDNRPRMDPKNIVVLVMYSAQASKIISCLDNYLSQDQYAEVRPVFSESGSGLEIWLVDAYQGYERDIVIGCFVTTASQNKTEPTSNPYATDNGRCCLILSRARHGLILVGNADALRKADKYDERTYAPWDFRPSTVSKIPGYYAEQGWFKTVYADI